MNILRRYFLRVAIFPGVVSVCLLLSGSKKLTTDGDTTPNGREQASIVSSARPTPPEQIRMQVAMNYGKLPLQFEANQGQTDARVNFISRGTGYTLFLTGDEAVFSLHRKKSLMERERASSASSGSEVSPDAVVHMRLVNANSAARVSGNDQGAGSSNYFLGNDSSRWRTNVPNFSQVRYEDVFPGIDLVYYGSHQQLEYDFVVAPGANPAGITLDVSSEDSSCRRGKHVPVRIGTNGDLVVSVGEEELSFRRPVVYQEDGSTPPHRIGGAKHRESLARALQGRWVMKNRTQVGFEVAGYDASKPLIIDPALFYSTYLGGSVNDVAQAVAVDSSGNAYVTGNTSSVDFPIVNPIQSTLNTNGDVFVSKLDPTGSTLIYSTYLGGSRFDSGFGIAVDSSGSAYVSGDTGSSDFPVTTGAFRTKTGGGTTDVFLSKLDPTGSKLVYSTYLGGSSTDRLVEGVAVDSAGEAFVTGWTTSTNFPVTTGAFQTTFHGTQEGFVTKFNSTGAGLVYSTFLGGTGSTTVNAIALDATGNAYVVGATSATDFPSTPGAVQSQLAGRTDWFVAKLNSTGSSLLNSTFLGGRGGDDPFGVALDHAGNVYVSGFTCSGNFPTTPGAYQTVYKGTCLNSNGAGGNAALAKFNSTLTSLFYSTLVGGTVNDVAYSVAVDSSGIAHLAGRTTSPDFPTTPGAFQTQYGGISDAFLAYISANGSALVYSTYLGGSGSEAAYVLVLDPSGNDILAGRTHSRDFDTTPAAFDPTCSKCMFGSTNGHAMVAKFVPGEQMWPLALSYGFEWVGVTAAAQTSTLTDSGSTDLSITGIAITGANAADFAENHTCGTSLAAGASCSISVTFNPSAVGARKASLSVTDSATNSPQQVALSGSGTTSAVSVTPSTLKFTPQLINTSSASQAVKITSTGATALTISNIATAPPYSQLNNCSASMSPGTSCTINVTFAPTVQGVQKGTLTVSDNAVGTPQTVALTGAGTVVSLSPSMLSFGNQSRGTSSAPQNITMTNIGSIAVSITTIGISGAQSSSFSQTNNCGSSLPSGASCTIAVTFTPQVTGGLNANVSVTDSGGSGPQQVHLSGKGI